MIGMAVIYLPLNNFNYFHTDARKREFVSCGMACGMAAAFGAPIGGTLFGYEISQPNYFWEVQSTWRTFIACSISVVMYSLLQDIYVHGPASEWVLDSATFDFSTVVYPTPTFGSLPGALIIGAVCGLLGALFVSMNTYCGMFRREHMSSSSLKMVEVTILALATTSFAYWLPYWVQAECYQGVSGDKTIVQYNCPKNQFNPLATLTMNSEGLIIRNIVSGFNEQANIVTLTTAKMGVFGIFWFIFSCLTYGSSLPSGPFLSAMLVGCSVGQIYENTRIFAFDLNPSDFSSLPIVMGAACMMSGYTRLSYSIVVLMLESSNSFNLAIPMIVGVFTTRTIADLFTNSLFDREIRNDQLPIIKGSLPDSSKDLKAHQIMSKKLVSIQSIAEMKSVTMALSSSHNAFPVLNTAGNLVGLLPKNILNILCDRKCFYETRRLSIATRQKNQ